MSNIILSTRVTKQLKDLNSIVVQSFCYACEELSEGGPIPAENIHKAKKLKNIANMYEMKIEYSYRMYYTSIGIDIEILDISLRKDQKKVLKQIV